MKVSVVDSTGRTHVYDGGTNDDGDNQRDIRVERCGALIVSCLRGDIAAYGPGMWMSAKVEEFQDD